YGQALTRLCALLKSTPEADDCNDRTGHHNSRHILNPSQSHDNDPETKDTVKPVLPHMKQ
ncbi:MAG TPA: hypothetical protein VF829_03040, partial [Candidatus Paceibacterota bacterium]